MGWSGLKLQWNEGRGDCCEWGGGEAERSAGRPPERGPPVEAPGWWLHQGCIGAASRQGRHDVRVAHHDVLLVVGAFKLRGRKSRSGGRRCAGSAARLARRHAREHAPSQVRSSPPLLPPPPALPASAPLNALPPRSPHLGAGVLLVEHGGADGHLGRHRILALLLRRAAGPHRHHLADRRLLLGALRMVVGIEVAARVRSEREERAAGGESCKVGLPAAAACHACTGCSPACMLPVLCALCPLCPLPLTSVSSRPPLVLSAASTTSISTRSCGGTGST